MTSKEFLQVNKDLLKAAVGTKINRLVQKIRRDKKLNQLQRVAVRKQKVNELIIIFDWLDNGKFED